MEKYIYKKEKLPVPVIEGKEEWVDFYYKAWEMVFDNIGYIEKEGWKPQLTCMPGVGIIWQWDSCFMTFITNYANGTITALNNLDNLYRLQREDGYISMAYRIDTEDQAYGGDQINPPLYSWVEYEAYSVSGDKARLAKVVPVIEKLYAHIERTHKRLCGLYWYESVGSAGMDNSPRSGFYTDFKGSDVCFIDLACQQALSAKYLGKIFDVLGNSDKKKYYEDEHKRICSLVNKFHWSEKGKFYYDFFDHENDFVSRLINTKTAASFWTLLSGVAKGERAADVVAHMVNPEEFYTYIPFASLSKDDLNYNSEGGYWLGGSWHPTNFAAVKGFKEAGYSRIAREASIKILDGMLETYKNPAYASIWESYAPEAPRPNTNKVGKFVRPNFVGWGGITPIAMLIEDIIGLRFEAQTNTVYYDIMPGKKSGLRNMHFNGGVISVECTEYRTGVGNSTVMVTTDKPLRLCLKTNYREEFTVDVPAGKTEIKV